VINTEEVMPAEFDSCYQPHELLVSSGKTLSQNCSEAPE